jgi:DNA polymerase-3 subunit epsilon
MIQQIGRECVFDVETTGNIPQEDRICEIGIVELMNGFETGKTFHRYVNPRYPMNEQAYEVHKLSADFLAEFEPFSAVLDDMLYFLGNDPIIAHNGNSFDFVMLNLELERCKRPPITNPTVDTIVHARRKFPGSRVGLDALCDRFGVDRKVRTKHGAIVDCELLARVYNHLMGRDDLLYALQEAGGPQRYDTVVHDDLRRCATQEWFAQKNPSLASEPLLATEDELRVHREFVGKMGDSVWSRLEAPAGPEGADA